jgi:hypothetical protein
LYEANKDILTARMNFTWFLICFVMINFFQLHGCTLELMVGFSYCIGLRTRGISSWSIFYQLKCPKISRKSRRE